MSRRPSPAAGRATRAAPRGAPARRRWGFAVAVALAGLAGWGWQALRGPRDPAPSERAAALPPDEDRRLAELLRAIDVTGADLSQEPDPVRWQARFQGAKGAEADLLAWFERSLPAAVAAQPVLLGYVRQAGRPEVVRRALRLLARNPDERALAVVLEAGARDPAVLSDDTWLRLAERGVPAARSRVEALAGDPERSSDQVFGAAWLAFQGSAAGRAALRWVVEQGDLLERSPDRWLLAAVALERLGEAGPWAEGLASLTDLVERRLAESPPREAEARWLTLRAAYYAGLRRGPTPRVSSVLDEAERFEREALGRHEGADGLRALLLRLRPTDR